MMTDWIKGRISGIAGDSDLLILLSVVLALLVAGTVFGQCLKLRRSAGPELKKLAENFNALMGAIIKAKPAAAKGQYVRSCTLASTMGPGVKINGAKLA